MSNTVTFTGITMHLEGTLPGVGDKAPDFSLADGELKARSLGDYSGRVLVLVCVPSLDTPVTPMVRSIFFTYASNCPYTFCACSDGMSKSSFSSVTYVCSLSSSKC